MEKVAQGPGASISCRLDGSMGSICLNFLAGLNLEDLEKPLLYLSLSFQIIVQAMGVQMPLNSA